MKPLALLTGLALAACSISHRSEDFACDKQSDCSAGRTCIDGFCVAGMVDAAVKIDSPPSVCPMQCTSCNGDTKTCTIDCALNNGACALPVVCPSGWSCNIACSTASACRSGINCSNARSCAITCSGRASCANFSCGPGACSVECLGRESCSTISCAASCACDINCIAGVSACTALTCKSVTCSKIQRGCTSMVTGCNTCP